MAHLLPACGGAVSSFYGSGFIRAGVRRRPHWGMRRRRRLLGRPYGHLRPCPGRKPAAQVSIPGLSPRLRSAAGAPNKTSAQTGHLFCGPAILLEGEPLPPGDPDVPDVPDIFPELLGTIFATGRVRAQIGTPACI